MGGGAYGGLAHNTGKKQLPLVALCYPSSKNTATCSHNNHFGQVVCLYARCPAKHKLILMENM